MRVRKENEKGVEAVEGSEAFFSWKDRERKLPGAAHPRLGGPAAELKLMDKGRQGLAIFIELTFPPRHITSRLVASFARADLSIFRRIFLCPFPFFLSSWPYVRSEGGCYTASCDHRFARRIINLWEACVS